MSMRISFFFINQTVKGGFYLANKYGGVADAAGTMPLLVRAASSCFA